MTVDADDTEALVESLRRGKGEEREQALALAYRRVFDWPVGRFVLAHILVEAGVGRPRFAEMGGEARAFHDGGAATAITIMNLAGFDEVSAALTIMTKSDEMKGRDHERDEHFSGPDRGSGILDDDG